MEKVFILKQTTKPFSKKVFEKKYELWDFIKEKHNTVRELRDPAEPHRFLVFVDSQEYPIYIYTIEKETDYERALREYYGLEWEDEVGNEIIHIRNHFKKVNEW